MFETNFTTLDWWIVAVYLAAAVAIGVLVNKFIHNVADLLQFILLSVGLAIGVCYCLTLDHLGWASITATLAQHRGEAAFNPVAAGG